MFVYMNLYIHFPILCTSFRLPYKNSDSHLIGSMTVTAEKVFFSVQSKVSTVFLRAFCKK